MTTTGHDDLEDFARLAAERCRVARHLGGSVDRLSKAARFAEKFWSSIEYDLDQRNMASLLLHLRKSMAALSDLRSTAAEVAELAGRVAADTGQDVSRLTDLCDMIAGEARSAAHRFHREFPGTAKQAGLELDRTSRFPMYTLHEGFIEFHAAPGSGEAIIKIRDGDRDQVMGLDVPEVIRRLKEEEARLFERPQPKGFIERLFTAYQAVLREEKREPGSEVPLRRVMNRLSKNIAKSRSFRADEFNVDLARLIASGDVLVRGHVMVVNQTRNKRQGMLLHGMEQGGYIGFISFKVLEKAVPV